MSITAQKQAILVSKLLKRTHEKKLTWIWQDVISEVICSVSGRTVGIELTENDRGENLYIVRIRDSDFGQIDTFNDETLKDITPTELKFRTYYLLIEELYELAKRQASGADQVLDEMLDELDDEEPF